jgi:hypothetical protein
VPDVSDFLGYLRDHEAEEVQIEIGARAQDRADLDLQLAKLCGQLGEFRIVDDGDRLDRGAAWVPVGDQDHEVGFYVHADLAVETVVNQRGAKVRFADGAYVAVVAFPRS